MIPRWTNHQARDLRSLVSQGIADGAVAERLGKSIAAVRRQRHRLGILRSFRRATGFTAREAHTISKNDLPTYYAIGWRVSWFEGNSVGIEWRHAGPPPDWLWSALPPPRSETI